MSYRGARLQAVSLLLACCLGGVCAAESITLSNDKLACEISLIEDQLSSETLRPLEQRADAVQTDGGFSIDLMWTGWRAPGRQNNADNPVLFTSQDFRYTHSTRRQLSQDEEEVSLYLDGINSTLELRIDYRLADGDFWLRRRIALRDTTWGEHFLRTLSSRSGEISGFGSIVKPGGFGQPVVLANDRRGVFLGLEDPASRNNAAAGADCITIECGREIGERVDGEWFVDEWTVLALAPDLRLQHWFNRYLCDIRVTPLRSYTLYNSWYDLRSEAIADDPLTVMNEENTLRVIGKLRRHMIDGQGIKLDAFVLDDGWDIYASDWVLRREEFPRGLLPISEALRETGTRLGIWFSPIGGYSCRDQRINWMREHGYETIGSQLCLAGDRYHRLFKQRVTDMVAASGVGFFKWDGIQFSCSKPDHGHPVGLYSRRAVLDAVKDLCHAVRREDPEVFLNITSGTWLSPWWVKYANQIWMDGYDFGWADVPSLSQRDGAITYRDMTLYEDFHTKNLWFPIANLMTHGIIKGHLQYLGGSDEPLDKFTDNALLYFARGVSMWELYISPDILTDGEWRAISSSIHWAQDRFEVLDETFMIGGDPGERQSYGYAHCDGNRAIIALRNPYVESTEINLKLLPEWGLNPAAAGLVVERTYPTRWIAPEVYDANDELILPLAGYETAVYELYPLQDAAGPLVTDVVFTPGSEGGALTVYPQETAPRLLKPDGASEPLALASDALYRATEDPLRLVDLAVAAAADSAVIAVELQVETSLHDMQLALLLETDADLKQAPPSVQCLLDDAGIEAAVQESGGWCWHILNLASGQSSARFTLSHAGDTPWQGHAALWAVGRRQLSPVSVNLAIQTGELREPLPPAPWPPGQVRFSRQLLDRPLVLE